MRASLGTTLLSVAVSGGYSPSQDAAAERPYRTAAVAAGRWLAECALESEDGLTWPVEPAASGDGAPHLYSGSPGVVLFFLELHTATGAEEHLALARRGAEHLAAGVPGELGAGLYTGVAGTGFVLAEAARATGDEHLRAAAVRCVEHLHRTAIEDGAGARWSDTTDVISGAAGTGLFLLYSAERLERPRDIALARRVGRWLIAGAESTEAGLSWPMDPTFPRRMPNFSHGTAGVAFFLASLHRATGEEDFLRAAQAGAAQLLALAHAEGPGLRIHHHTPGGEELFYLGWCHGPTGTARLFRRLHGLRPDAGWDEHVRACTVALVESGIPEKRPEGFWNNVGQCCGSAGVAEYLLGVGELDFARRLADDVLARAQGEDGRQWWVQAEHRVRPEFLQAQTGYMQGAAGVGLMLLHLDAAEQERERSIRFPDEP